MKLNAATRLEATKDLELTAGMDDMLDHIIKSGLKPAVDNAKKQIDQAVKHTAEKVRVWALTHLRQAQQLGRPTVLFEKLINDPVAATEQLAHSMLGVPIARAPSKEEKALDDLLDGLSI